MDAETVDWVSHRMSLALAISCLLVWSISMHRWSGFKFGYACPWSESYSQHMGLVIVRTHCNCFVASVNKGFSPVLEHDLFHHVWVKPYTKTGKIKHELDGGRTPAASRSREMGKGCPSQRSSLACEAWKSPTQHGIAKWMNRCTKVYDFSIARLFRQHYQSCFNPGQGLVEWFVPI
jgi:hypothetical protein